MDQHGHGPSTRTHLFGSASEAPQWSRDPYMNTHALYLLTKSRSHSGVFPLLWQLPSLPPAKKQPVHPSTSSGQTLSKHKSGIVSSLLMQLRFSDTKRNRRSKAVVQVV